MQKNGNRWTVKTLVFMSLLVAMHLILTRIIVLDLGPYRVSVGSVCTILAGLWLGPVAGGTCGFAADIIGCFMKGYAINPVITLAAILWGVIPALMKPLFIKREKIGKTIGIVISVTIANIICSFILTTLGLVYVQGYSLVAILPGRIAQLILNIPVYSVLTCILYFSPLTKMVYSITSGNIPKRATL